MKYRSTYKKILEALRGETTCLSQGRAALVVSPNGSIIATGYNGVPRKIRHCTDIGVCPRENSPSGADLGKCRAAHAEANCIANSALEGIRLKDGTMWCTDSPCYNCAILIINSGIAKVVYFKEYPAPGALELLREAGVVVKHAKKTKS